MKAAHIIMLACGSLAGGLPALATKLPPQATPYILGAGAICALAAMVLGAVTDSMFSKGGPS